MGDTFNNVQEQMKEKQLFQRASLILEEQDTMVMFSAIWDSISRCFCIPPTLIKNRQTRRRAKDFPEWLHVLAPVENDVTSSGDKQREQIMQTLNDLQEAVNTAVISAGNEQRAQLRENQAQLRENQREILDLLRKSN